MRIAHIYNSVTGASISHKDVGQWGIYEREKIMSALDIWDKI